jgi:hypothetical protein
LDNLDKSDKLDKQDNRLLHICLYYIEREFNFTSDGLFSGSHAQLFSPELKAEIEKYQTGRDVTEKTAVYNKGWYFLVKGVLLSGKRQGISDIAESQNQKVSDRT